MALGLATLREGKYANSADSSHYLVSGKPASLAGLAKVNASTLEPWTKLAVVAKTGAPVEERTADLPSNPFWEELVPAITPLSAPVPTQRQRP